MKLIRFGQPGNENPGVLTHDGQRLDVSDFGADYNQQFFADDGIQRLSTWLGTNQDQCLVVDEQVRWGSPICMPSKLICVGLNYAAHATESGLEIPKQPVIFSKATSSIGGPFDAVIIPRNSEKTDWEVELAIVIGKKASYVSREQAMDHVAGYVLHNDVSERAFQLEQGGQ
ncbi:MAG: fumarylacetoacetate hydrolase family protein, partial [Saprospiraceae bacterium]|nr:fumarylacetoacetate hydrolase family protein [Saprospiraceae bacterium]